MKRDDSNLSATLVRKLWQYCNVLRDDGLSYPDYVEQLTYLLFLKMADERSAEHIPSEHSWKSLVGLNADQMHRHYAEILGCLGEYNGMLGLIFHNAKNKIRDPGKLRLLVVELIGQTEWSSLPIDLKGNAYEGLLEKNARDTKSGAGQYFTPRPLIEVMVECVAPQLGELVCDPACGTAGFLLAAHDYLVRQNPRISHRQQQVLATKTVRGVELVEEVARLATMNLLLHGIAGSNDDELPVQCGDSLKEPPSYKADVVLTNPPFGIKGSVTYKGGERRSPATDELTIHRPDFWVQTANKQLNFLQHVVTLLKPGGRAAVVVPDNVLFEGGVGSTIRRRLLETCDVHTLLRLPPGLFYAQGVKANVLFFDRPEKLPTRNDDLWVYDLRAENRFSVKTRPLQREDLEEFVELYMPAQHTRRSVRDVTQKRWRRFSLAEIAAERDCSFDLTWFSEQPAAGNSGLSRLDEISRLITEDLQRALAKVSKIVDSGSDRED